MAVSDKHTMLKKLPGVDHLLAAAEEDERFAGFPRSLLLKAIRSAIQNFRNDILTGSKKPVSGTDILESAFSKAFDLNRPHLVNVINATGVVLHTNLGRALLCNEALSAVHKIGGAYSNLEFNIRAGKRGSRYEAVENLICELTGARSAIAVNNNAGAVLLALNTIAKNSQVVVSRGELIEIGGSFRIPDVMSKSGCILKEVGTTNRTHLRDYENAVSEDTGLFLKVHASNYHIKGFTESVSLGEMVSLGKANHIPVMEDLGSGTLIDFSKYGLPKEPTVADSIKTGADVVTFSGDKLLGGPQAGIIAGQKKTIDKIKNNPLTRALRIDKLTLAALEATLKLYRDEEKAVKEIPALRMLTLPFETICNKADRLVNAIRDNVTALADIGIADMNSRPGGGAFPEINLPTRCITIRPKSVSVSGLEKYLRLSNPAIITRIEDNLLVLDPRTIQTGQEEIISTILGRVLKPK